MKKETLKKIGYPALSLAFWVGVWWLLAARFDRPLLLPTPAATLKAFFALAGTSLFWQTVAVSLGRILGGILAALAAGVLLAVLTVKSRFFDRLFAPLLALFKATPIAPVIFLLLLWVGRVRIPFLIAFMMALPIVWSNVSEGLLHTDKQLLEMAKVFRVPQKEQFLRIRIPSVAPYFLAACRSALGISWKAGVAAEVLCLPQISIGVHIYEGKLYLLTDEMFAWTLTVVLISVAVEAAAFALLRLTARARKKEVGA